MENGVTISRFLKLQPKLKGASSEQTCTGAAGSSCLSYITTWTGRPPPMHFELHRLKLKVHLGFPSKWLLEKTETGRYRFL